MEEPSLQLAKPAAEAESSAPCPPVIDQKEATSPSLLAPQRHAATLASTASERTVEDGTTPMGIGTCRTLDRVAAALGGLDQAELRFLPSDDIPHGGLLCALPALLAMGLLRHTDGHFKLPKGFYPLECIFMLLAFLALAIVLTVRKSATKQTSPSLIPDVNATSWR